MKIRRFSCLLAVACGLAFSAASAQVPTPLNPYTYSGSFGSGGPTFHRPNSSADPSAGTTFVPDELSQRGNAFFYNVQPFVLTLSDSVTITVNRATINYEIAAPDDDTYLVLYQGAFDPSQPLLNAIAANDDVTSSSLRSQLTFNLSAGTQYYAVTTTFNALQDSIDPNFNVLGGSFENSIAPASAANAVLPVPEPTTWALLALGAATLALPAMRHRQRAA